MKIAQITPGNMEIPPKGWGAIERVIWEYKLGLEKYGHQVDIKYPHIDTVPVGEDYGDSLYEYDIVHVHMANQCVDDMIQLHDPSIKYFFTMDDHHTFEWGKDSAEYKRNLAAINGSVKSFVAANYLLKYFNNNKLSYLSHGVDTNYFVPGRNRNNSLLCVGHNGLINNNSFDRKGFGYAIKAAMKLDLPITVAGAKPNNKIFFDNNKELANYSKLQILYDVTQEELLRLYQTHSIFIHPSSLEAGHPNLTLLESLSCGLPIVGTHERPLDGMMICDRDVDEIIFGVEKILDDYDYYSRVARKTAEQHSWQIICKKLEEHYMEMKEQLKKTYFGHIEKNIINTDKKFLIVCSFYNNTKEHIKQMFDNIINQTYKNWLFIISDDSSKNNCKELLLDELKKRNHPNIIYHEQKFRRELFFFQNFFNSINYDYIMLPDSDDIISPKLLESYHRHFEKYPEIFSIASDFDHISEDKRRERISLVKPSDDYIEEFKERTPLEHGGTNGRYWHIWSKYYSWSMYGECPCFLKSKLNAFSIKVNSAGDTAVDSFWLFSSLIEGNHFTLPRNLFAQIGRSDSGGHTQPHEEYVKFFNTNTLFAIDNYSKNTKFGSVKVYDDIWLETSALSTSNFVEGVSDINLITDIDELQLEKISYLYYDKNITLNNSVKQNLVIVWNKLNGEQRTRILEALQNYEGNFSIYNFHDNFDVLEDDMEKYLEDESHSFLNFVGDYVEVNWFSYFRSIVVWNVK
jgi:glycosyltransferase involved in cell wall biosynthesis